MEKQEIVTTTSAKERFKRKENTAMSPGERLEGLRQSADIMFAVAEAVLYYFEVYQGGEEHLSEYEQSLCRSIDIAVGDLRDNVSAMLT